MLNVFSVFMADYVYTVFYNLHIIVSVCIYNLIVCSVCLSLSVCLSVCLSIQNVVEAEEEEEEDDEIVVNHFTSLPRSDKSITSMAASSSSSSSSSDRPRPRPLVIRSTFLTLKALIFSQIPSSSSSSTYKRHSKGRKFLSISRHLINIRVSQFDRERKLGYQSQGGQSWRKAGGSSIIIIIIII